MINNATIDRIYFHLSTVVFILFVVSLYSFYPHYLGVLHTPLPWFMHIHFALMVAWMALLFAQPILIRKKNYGLHKKLGSVSYLLVPLILIFSFMMIQFGYQRVVAELSIDPGFTPDQAVYQAKKDMGLGFSSFFVLLVFYSLAIVYRKRSAFHVRFMIAAATSIAGPILDRAIYLLAEAAKFPSLKYEYVTFFLLDITFLLLLFRDYRRGQPLAPNLTIIIFFILAHIGYGFFLGSPAWQWFVGTIL